MRCQRTLLLRTSNVLPHGKDEIFTSNPTSKIFTSPPSKRFAVTLRSTQDTHLFLGNLSGLARIAQPTLFPFKYIQQLFLKQMFSCMHQLEGNGSKEQPKTSTPGTSQTSGNMTDPAKTSCNLPSTGMSFW